jgi:hypothetical protein
MIGFIVRFDLQSVHSKILILMELSRPSPCPRASLNSKPYNWSEMPHTHVWTEDLLETELIGCLLLVTGRFHKTSLPS